MATEQQSVNASSSGPSSGGNASHKKAGPRNGPFRHPSARGSQRYNSNGETGANLPFMPPDMPLHFNPSLLAGGGFYPHQTAMYDYSVVNGREMGPWSGASELPSMQLLSGAPIYDPAFATGGYLSPSLVNAGSFPPVGGPFAYEGELFNVCGVAEPAFAFASPGLNLPPTSWESFQASSSDYPAWPVQNKSPGSEPNPAGNGSVRGSSPAHPETNGTTASDSLNARPQASTSGSEPAEALSNQLSLLRVAPHGSTAPSYASVSAKAISAAHASSAAPSNSSLATSKSGDTDTTVSHNVTSTSSLPKTTDDAIPLPAKGKLLNVAKRREITYAGVVKAGTETLGDNKSSRSAAPTASAATNGLNSTSTIQKAASAASAPQDSVSEAPETLLERLRTTVNPLNFDAAAGSRFFVIKSYSEDDVHRSIKYGIWCSTVHGNQKLDAAYRAVTLSSRRADSALHEDRTAINSHANVSSEVPQAKTVVGLTYPLNQPPKSAKQEAKTREAVRAETADAPQPGVFLFFSVNGSGHFCGVAQMTSTVDYEARAGVWEQDKWRGKLDVRWIFVKDVPNSALRNVRLENNDNKPVTNSRDTQEVPLDKAQQVLRVFTSFPHTTSLFDDFLHYEQKQLEAARAKANPSASNNNSSANPALVSGPWNGGDWRVSSDWPHADWQSKQSDWNTHVQPWAVHPGPNDWTVPHAEWHVGANGDSYAAGFWTS